MYHIIFIVASALVFIEGKHLPTYITACKKDDPNVNKCAKEHGQAAISYILKGDSDYKVPLLSPFYIPEIRLQATKDLLIKLNDVYLRGLDTVNVDDVNIDFEKKHISGKLIFKYFGIEGQYDIDGRILVVPIKGKGAANITGENLMVTYSFDYKLTKKKDGKEYMEATEPTITYSVGKLQVHFDDLFNGDKELADRTNDFLNEHAMEINEDFSSAIAETIKAIASNILFGITPIVPFDEIFL